MKETEKQNLLNFIRDAGFDWICDIKYENGIEWVASKKNGSDELWWRSYEVEGSGFEQLFMGSIKDLYKIEEKSS